MLPSLSSSAQVCGTLDPLMTASRAKRKLEKVKYINKPRILLPVLCSPRGMNENLQQ